MSKYFSQRSLLGSFVSDLVYNEVPAGVIDGSNASFMLAYEPESPNSIMLFKNGMAQAPGSGKDYTISGQTITFEAGNLPQSGDNLLVTYQRS